MISIIVLLLLLVVYNYIISKDKQTIWRNPSDITWSKRSHLVFSIIMLHVGGLLVFNQDFISKDYFVTLGVVLYIIITFSYHKLYQGDWLGFGSGKVSPEGRFISLFTGNYDENPKGYVKGALIYRVVLFILSIVIAIAKPIENLSINIFNYFCK